MHYFRKECESYVKGFPGARYKKFSTEDEAKSFVSGLKSSGSLTSAVAAPSVSVDKLIDGWFTRRSYVVYFNCILLNVRIRWETQLSLVTSWVDLNPFTPKFPFFKFSLLSSVQFSWWYFREFDIRTSNNFLIDVILFSDHLSAS